MTSFNGHEITKSLEVAPVERDLFVAESVGAEIDFSRDRDGKVIALTLKQRGAVLKGERKPDTASSGNDR